MSDHNHDKHRDATSDERVQQQRQPAPEPSLAEQVVAQFRMQNPRAWFEASPLERFQARQAAFDQQRQLVLQMSRHTLGLGPATQQVKQIAGAGLQGASTGMPFQQQIQSSFGKHDVSSVRSTVGGPAEQANTQLGSLAYASGDAIAFRQQPDLFTAAHEAAHIVQQRAGVSLKSGIGQVGDTYEQHADAVASLVVQGKSAESLLDRFAPGNLATAKSPTGVVQHRKGTSESKKKSLATANLTKKIPVGMALGAGMLLSKNSWKPMIVPRGGQLLGNAKKNRLLSVVEDWIGKYNDAAMPIAGAFAARGRIQIMDSAGLDHMNPKSYVAEFEKLGTLAESDAQLKILRGQVSNSADVPSALAKVRSAQAMLRSVRLALQKQRNLAKKASLLARKAKMHDKVAAIQARIAAITEAITQVEAIAAKVASVYATAGASLTITDD
ncbi:MAG: DUF4157 domain-containing protein, partial [Myxococcales bacterium]|nr:DUF4157 domain-containing protein [Myxococcales bacterium]